MSKKKDFNQRAFDIVGQLTGSMPKEEPPPSPSPGKAKNAAAVELGRLGGLKGGKARAAKLTPKKRKEIAKRAAAARWKKI